MVSLLSDLPSAVDGEMMVASAPFGSSVSSRICSNSYMALILSGYIFMRRFSYAPGRDHRVGIRTFRGRSLAR
jgi:hypothetical protein